MKNLPKNKLVRIPPYNPLDKTNLGESIAEAVLMQPIISLPLSETFIGAGVYAIYYEGDFPLYKLISQKNKNRLYEWPIYIGKAIPAGGRKGGYGLGADPGIVLFKRLSEHATSIEQTSNLSIRDFRCRFLVVDDIWIPLAENILIEMLSPIWNLIIDGFGNHDPGSGRRNQQSSLWDILHPGRPWALKLKQQSINEEKIKDSIGKLIMAMQKKT